MYLIYFKVREFDRSLLHIRVKLHVAECHVVYKNYEVSFKITNNRTSKSIHFVIQVVICIFPCYRMLGQPF